MFTAEEAMRYKNTDEGAIHSNGSEVTLPHLFFMVWSSTLSPALQSHTHLLFYPFTSKDDFYFKNISNMSSQLPMNRALISCLDHYNKLFVTTVFSPNMIFINLKQHWFKNCHWLWFVHKTQFNLLNVAYITFHNLAVTYFSRFISHIILQATPNLLDSLNMSCSFNYLYFWACPFLCWAHLSFWLMFLGKILIQ